jgi:hypothetical protein
VTEPANEPAWHTDVTEASWLSDPPAATGKRVRYVFPFMGRRYKATAEILGYEAGREERLIVRGAPMGMTPTVTFRFEPQDGATRFTRSVDVETAGFRALFDPLVRRMIGRKNAVFVRQLKERLEG